MCDLLSLPLPWPVREQTIVWLVTRQSRTVLLVVPTLYEGRCADHLSLLPCSRARLGHVLGLLATEDTALPSSERICREQDGD